MSNSLDNLEIIDYCLIPLYVPLQNQRPTEGVLQPRLLKLKSYSCLVLVYFFPQHVEERPPARPTTQRGHYFDYVAPYRALWGMTRALSQSLYFCFFPLKGILCETFGQDHDHSKAETTITQKPRPRPFKNQDHDHSKTKTTLTQKKTVVSSLPPSLPPHHLQMSCPRLAA